MKIHSDKLTKSDLYECAAGSGAWIDEMSEGRSRSRVRRFEVYLNGSSRYAAQHGGKAATWDEWGIWIDRLFDIDPQAIIGPYDGRDDFIEQTQNESQRVAKYHSPTSYQARNMTAPWLTA